MIARHGQGWHNFGSAKHGLDVSLVFCKINYSYLTPHFFDLMHYQKWEEYWTYLNNDDQITWGPDPELTPLGKSQAQAVNRCWVAEAPLGAPIKSEEMRWYVSPMIRTGQTLEESWGALLGRAPEVWEDWREVYGGHTCDKRSTKVSHFLSLSHSFSFFPFPLYRLILSLSLFFHSLSHKMHRTNRGNRLYYRKGSPTLRSKKG